MEVPKKYFEIVDQRIRRLINRFLKGQSIQKSFIYANVMNGGLDVPNINDGYAAYRVNHVANLMSTEVGRQILLGCINLNKKIAVNQDLIRSLEKALDQFGIDWPDWTMFRRDGKAFEWTKTKKMGNSNSIS
jgi:hypothetical protein